MCTLQKLLFHSYLHGTISYRWSFSSKFWFWFEGYCSIWSYWEQVYQLPSTVLVVEPSSNVAGNYLIGTFTPIFDCRPSLKLGLPDCSLSLGPIVVATVLPGWCYWSYSWCNHCLAVAGVPFLSTLFNSHACSCSDE